MVDLMAVPQVSTFHTRIADLSNQAALYALSVLHILFSEYGFGKSLEETLPVDGAGGAIPLYTYPAIDYLEQLDMSQAKVFEYGSGMSTLWCFQQAALCLEARYRWAARSNQVVAVENSKDWYKDMLDRSRNYSHVNLVFEVAASFAHL
jgi:hypothetical protein